MKNSRRNSSFPVTSRPHGSPTGAPDERDTAGHHFYAKSSPEDATSPVLIIPTPASPRLVSSSPQAQRVGSTILRLQQALSSTAVHPNQVAPSPDPSRTSPTVRKVLEFKRLVASLRAQVALHHPRQPFRTAYFPTNFYFVTQF